MRGLLETIGLAREQGDAQAMIGSAAEIDRMLRFDLLDKPHDEARCRWSVASSVTPKLLQ